MLESQEIEKYLLMLDELALKLPSMKDEISELQMVVESGEDQGEEVAEEDLDLMAEEEPIEDEEEQDIMMMKPAR